MHSACVSAGLRKEFYTVISELGIQSPVGVCRRKELPTLIQNMDLEVPPCGPYTELCIRGVIILHTTHTPGMGARG